MQETPLDIARNYTRGLIFPATKDQVLEALESNRAPHEAVEIIRSVRHPRFASPNDIQTILYSHT